MMKRVAFRTDASLKIGSGHVSRCLALAEALVRRGVECAFLTRAHAGHMDDRIRAAGHVVLSLGTAESETAGADNAEYADWLGAAPARDAETTRERLASWQPDWVVVDHYALGREWENTVAETGCRVLAIDDLANRPHTADVLLDQNRFEAPQKRYEGLLNETCTPFFGPRYALLRSDYRQTREVMGGPERERVSRVLVYFGGVDAPNLTGAALTALEGSSFAGVAVDLVVGPHHPSGDDLTVRARSRPLTYIHGHMPHLADLMQHADLAIGAGGTTTWERCTLGLPAIVVSVAANQCEPARGLESSGAIRFLGRHGRLSDAVRAIADAVETLCRDHAERNAMAVRAWRLCDGFGAERVAERLAPTPGGALALRPAGRRDLALCHEWASDPVTRANSFHPEPIPWSDHVGWFESKLADPDSALLVMETPHGLPVGQARLDRRDGVVSLSYSIDLAFRGRGWGRRLLDLAVSAWRERWNDVDLVGEVKPENVASHKTMRRAGFVEERRAPDRVCLRFPRREKQDE